MKYEKPEVTVLALALEAIQNSKATGDADGQGDTSAAYEDWE